MALRIHGLRVQAFVATPETLETAMLNREPYLKRPRLYFFGRFLLYIPKWIFSRPYKNVGFGRLR